jgi:hypothetical protein
VSCYELGHQPIGLAQPLGFLERAGYSPAALDIAVEKIDTARIADALFVGISVPMHTALRLGVRVADLVRKTNPHAHICFYGLYASINAGYLLDHAADTVIGGEYEVPLMTILDRLDRGDPNGAAGGRQSSQIVRRICGGQAIFGTRTRCLPGAQPRRAAFPGSVREAGA